MSAHVAIAADGAFVEHGLVTMRSVLAHAGDADVVVHFLHGDDLSEEWAQRLADAAREGGGTLVLRKVDSATLSGVVIQEGKSLANWFRYLLPDLLPEVDTVLYLDCDAVAADDLGPLFATPLDDCYVAAVDGIWARLRPREPTRLVLPPGQKLFNAGVMLMNLAAMREDGMVAQLLAHGLFMGDEAFQPNQDALNAVLGARRVELDVRWNLMTGALLFPEHAERAFGPAFAEAVRRPGIRHFEGIAKPWDEDHPVPGRELYLSHR